MAVDIERKRGDTYPIEIVVEETISGTQVPLDITGASFVLTVDPVKDPVDDSANLFQLTGTITDAVNGAVSFYPTTVDADHVGKFYYDVQMIDGAGKIRTIVKAVFKLVQDITKI